MPDPTTIRVTTNDANPGVEPHTISQKPAYDSAHVEIDWPEAGEGQHYGCVLITLTPLRTGNPVARRGTVCGLHRVGPQSRPLKVAGPFTMYEDIDYAEFLPGTPDGPVPMTVHNLTEAGWS